MTKSEVRRDMSIFWIWHHKLFCMHVYNGVMPCKSVRDVKSHPFWLSHVPNDASFFAFKKPRMCTMFWTGAKIYYIYYSKNVLELELMTSKLKHTTKSRDNLPKPLWQFLIFITSVSRVSPRSTRDLETW